MSWGDLWCWFQNFLFPVTLKNSQTAFHFPIRKLTRLVGSMEPPPPRHTHHTIENSTSLIAASICPPSGSLPGSLAWHLFLFEILIVMVPLGSFVFSHCDACSHLLWSWRILEHIDYLSVDVMRHHDQGNLWKKSCFWLMVPEGRSPWEQGRGSR